MQIEARLSPPRRSLAPPHRASVALQDSRFTGTGAVGRFVDADWLRDELEEGDDVRASDEDSPRPQSAQAPTLYRHTQDDNAVGAGGSNARSRDVSRAVMQQQQQQQHHQAESQREHEAVGEGPPSPSTDTGLAPHYRQARQPPGSSIHPHMSPAIQALHSSHPPHRLDVGPTSMFAGYSFGAMHPHALNPAINIRNTRPMTAPSGVSAPFLYQAQLAGPSSFYAPSTGHGVPPDSFEPAIGSYADSSAYQPTFQYSVDNHVPLHAATTGQPLSHAAFPVDQQMHRQQHFTMQQRERGFSLPDIAPVPPGSLPESGLPDDVRYSSGGSDGRESPNALGGPFMYVPPPRAPTYPQHALDPGIPSLGDPRELLGSRPLTAESSRPTSSHTPRTARDTGSASGSKTYNFVTSGGQATKRPRRRYDEIERLYGCDYPGCKKAYGTLNHLNSHKTMQKHGPKSTPAQFKEMRKAWRERKKAAAAEAAKRAATEEAANIGSSSAPTAARDRPRPSTSAGEYHYNVPAPFAAPSGMFAPHLTMPSTASTLIDSSMSAPSGMFAPSPFVIPTAAGNHPGMYAMPQASVSLSSADSSSAHRPVTAPNYYGAPAFGYSLSNGVHSAIGDGGLRYGLPLGAGDSMGNVPPPARRMSLPGISELKQPTPVFGYGIGSAEEGIGAIEEEAALSGANNDFDGDESDGTVGQNGSA